MALQLMPQEENLTEKLGRGLGTGLGGGIQQLAKSNLDRLLGRQNYFQQNMNQLLKDLGVGSQPTPTQQGFLGLQQPQIQPQLTQGVEEPQATTQPVSSQVSQQSKLNKKEQQDQRKIQVQQEKEQKKLQAHQEKVKKQMTGEERADQKLIDKDTLPFYKDTLKAEKGAIGSDLRLNRMEELVNKGSLPVSHFYRLFKSLSEVDIGKNAPIVGPLAGLVANPVLNLIGGSLLAAQRSITSTDTEEFEKLSNDFVKDVKDIFGARVTQGEVERYLKTIPTLEQTDAGKLKVIRNLRSFNKLAELRAKTMKDIIKENNGNRPKNLEILVDDRMDPILDEIALEFKTGVQPYPNF